MRAFAYLSQGQAGWIEKKIPKPTGVDGVIRPLLVAPCTSDVHNVAINCLAPHRILGHEGLGEIVAVGEGVKDFQVGEVVVVPPVTPDWRTVPSQLGAHQHCSGLITGQKLSNSEDGLMAEYALIRDLDANAARIPPGVSWEGAVMAADMLNTGLYGAQLADVQPGDTVVVMGVGPVGLMAIAGARLRGAGRILAIGSRKAGVELAQFYGATDVLNYKEGDVTRQVYALTHKQGADCCICAGGGTEALGQAVAMVRWGGHRGERELLHHLRGPAREQRPLWLRHGQQDHPGRRVPRGPGEDGKAPGPPPVRPGGPRPPDHPPVPGPRAGGNRLPPHGGKAPGTGEGRGGPVILPGKEVCSHGKSLSLPPVRPAPGPGGPPLPLPPRPQL